MTFRIALLSALVALAFLTRESSTTDARYSRGGVISFLAKTDFESSLRQLTPGQSPGFILAPDFVVSSYAWAPTGDRVAVVATAANDLWVETLFDGNLAHISSGAGSATWSPDGTQLAFVDQSGAHLYVATPDGQSVEPILNGSGLKNPAWSPLGNSIVFEAGSALKKIAPSGGTAIPLDGGTGAKMPAWSPFGDRIAALKGDKVIILDDEGDLEGTLDETDGATGFSWSADGTAIAYNGEVDNDEAIFVTAAGGSSTAGSEPLQISSAADFAGVPAFSPDGRFVAYTLGNSGEKPELFWVAANGGGEQRLTDNVVLDEQAVGWQPLTVLVGDGDCSGAVDMSDFTALMRSLAGLGATECSLALNARCDDPLTAADAVPLLQHLAGVPVTLPDGCFAIGS